MTDGAGRALPIPCPHNYRLDCRERRAILDGGEHRALRTAEAGRMMNGIWEFDPHRARRGGSAPEKTAMQDMTPNSGAFS